MVTKRKQALTLSDFDILIELLDNIINDREEVAEDMSETSLRRKRILAETAPYKRLRSKLCKMEIEAGLIKP